MWPPAQGPRSSGAFSGPPPPVSARRRCWVLVSNTEGPCLPELLSPTPRPLRKLRLHLCNSHARGASHTGGHERGPICCDFIRLRGHQEEEERANRIRAWARGCFTLRRRISQSVHLLVFSNQAVPILTAVSEKSPHLLALILASNCPAVLPQSLLVSFALSLGLIAR